MGRRIVQPLNVLASDARTIARGVTDHRSRVTDASEIGVLANAFNHMADTVERRSAALADSERRYRLLFDSNPLPMWAWDAESMEILAVNEAAIDHYGYDRDTFLSMHITDIIDPVDHPRFNSSRLPFSETRQNAGTWTHRTADGRRIEMDVVTTSSRRLGRASWLSVGIDITARREAERALAQSEEQLRQAQKMEAIGAFAGGIAHDFNNLLTGMLGYCDLALLDLDGDNPLRADLVEIRKLAVRGAELTRQILAVSRKQVVQPTVLEPNAIVRGLDRLLARLIGEHIRVETALDDALPRIRVDAGQLEQVLLNLAANARDAMPGGGVLRVSTRTVSPDERLAKGLDPQRAWVALSVQDNGIGMNDEVQQRIFEPFFTTKERGKGTGLGLALAYSMVDQAGGVIRVDSVPGDGSTFTLYFPAVDDSLTPFSSGEHVLRDLHGTETILLAEDEDAVRSIASSALQRWGYRVLSATDGSAALDISRQHNGHIDLLLTDVVMPGMNGRELAEVLKRERPDMRILYASGYTDDAALLRDIRTDDLPFIQKPFTTTELVQRVRDALDEKVQAR
jgi:PAS domain S-box-containing protein